MSGALLDVAALVRHLAELPPEELRPLAEALAPLLAEYAPPELLTTEEVAAVLRTTPRGIHDRVYRGGLVAQHDGGRLLFRRADVEAYLARQPEPRTVASALRGPRDPASRQGLRGGHRTRSSVTSGVE